MTLTSHVSQDEKQSKCGRALFPESAPYHRQRALKVPFVHLDAGAVRDCLHELKKAQFEVISDVVSNLAECAAQLRFKSYDFIVVEYPKSSSKGSPMLRLLDETRREITLIVLSSADESKSVADVVSTDACEYVELKHINQCQ